MRLRGYFWHFSEVHWETDDVVESICTLAPFEGRCSVLSDTNK
jgi:hypothetical protein